MLFRPEVKKDADDFPKGKFLGTVVTSYALGSLRFYHFAASPWVKGIRRQFSLYLPLGVSSEKFFPQCVNAICHGCSVLYGV